MDFETKPTGRPAILKKHCDQNSWSKDHAQNNFALRVVFPAMKEYSDVKLLAQKQNILSLCAILSSQKVMFFLTDKERKQIIEILKSFKQ